jgi:hypothetical protein
VSERKFNFLCPSARLTAYQGGRLAAELTGLTISSQIDSVPRDS